MFRKEICFGKIARRVWRLYVLVEWSFFSWSVMMIDMDRKALEICSSLLYACPPPGLHQRLRRARLLRRFDQIDVRLARLYVNSQQIEVSPIEFWHICNKISISYVLLYWCVTFFCVQWGWDIHTWSGYNYPTISMQLLHLRFFCFETVRSCQFFRWQRIL